MNNEQKEILKALWKIKTTCDKYTGCELCPLSDNYRYDCIIRGGFPNHWNLKSPGESEDKWCAFNEPYELQE